MGCYLREKRPGGEDGKKTASQYEESIYHVIKRGNYRREVFGTVGAAQAFEKVVNANRRGHAVPFTLTEAASLPAWRDGTQTTVGVSGSDLPCD